MKKTTEQLLESILSTTVLFKYGADGIEVEDLIYAYAEQEVHSANELLQAPQEVEAFLMRNIGQINYDKDIDGARLRDLIDYKCKSLSKKLTSLFKENQLSSFSDIVSEIAPDGKSSHILDVGPGKIPMSSILLGERFDKVSAMDSSGFVLPRRVLKNLNVDGKKQYFDDKTPIDDYDMIVGQSPCSAIEPIVKKCAEEGKPYFIEVCRCAVPPKFREFEGTRAYGWEKALRKYDTRFYGTIAYDNVDATEEQVRKVVDRYKKSKLIRDLMHLDVDDHPITTFIRVPSSRQKNAMGNAARKILVPVAPKGLGE